MAALAWWTGWWANSFRGFAKGWLTDVDPDVGSWLQRSLMDACAAFGACRLRVRGLVQGVGFRPHAWRLATELKLVGTVHNDAQGVAICVAGDKSAIVSFRKRLRSESPPLARIDSIEEEPWLPDAFPDGFSIGRSVPGSVATGVVPDAATCPDCLRDIRDPSNRRYRYPFTNCTHCGPRLSIVRQVPYDRATTAMAAFEMCGACAAEYADPADRRFHAQPNACPECGPRLWLEMVEDGHASEAKGVDPIETTAQMLRSGRIVAIKGLAGFHLACDAANEQAVACLRERKRRDAKPLAVMVQNVATARQLCHVDQLEVDMLESAAAPIVLLKPRQGREGIAPSVALGQASLGLMLPYTPLHHLLLDAFGGPLVMTSGNRSDEPQVIANEQAYARLCSIADAFLMHDRDIVNRVDDSVGRVERGAFQLIRRARGFAPQPVAYPPGFPRDRTVLAMGSALKNTFALTTPDGIVLSPHCGDLDNPEAVAAYRETLELYQRMFDGAPDTICADGHPDYPSTLLGQDLAQETNAQVVTVAHHHAHIASVLGENAYPLDGPPVIGLALDGLGLGPDGTFWGGEVLLAGYRSAERLAGLPAVPMPGGDRASREPWRNLVAHLHAAGLDPYLAGFDHARTKTLVQMIDRGINAPKASSAGRLFDAFAALLGLHPERVGFEGQAAMALEALAQQTDTTENGYAIRLPRYVSDGTGGTLHAFWRDALADRDAGKGPARMAYRFHAGLADALATCAIDLAREKGSSTVALSGGVFLNQLLTELLVDHLESSGLTVLSHRNVPCNDGGLSLGQVLVTFANS